METVIVGEILKVWGVPGVVVASVLAYAWRVSQGQQRRGPPQDFWSEMQHIRVMLAKIEVKLDTMMRDQNR